MHQLALSRRNLQRKFEGCYYYTYLATNTKGGAPATQRSKACA